MNRYRMICRLRWPAALLLTGVIALLDQADILHWHQAWPLYLILFGVLALAERLLLANEPPPVYPYPGYGQYPVAGAAPQAPPQPAPAAPAAAAESVPARADFSANASEEER